MTDNRAIGVFDSGLGGLTVMRSIASRLPGERIVYFGDTGRVPYGNRGERIIRRYAQDDEKFLLKQEVKMIVAACGTVSSVAADTGKTLPVPFFEMITHAAKMAATVTKNKKIGVLGTAATINSGSHKKAIAKILPDAKVTACACPMFVPFVEEGWVDPQDPLVQGIVARYVEPLIAAGCDTVILGCTHYPLLSAAIRRALPGAALIDPGVAVAGAIEQYLIEHDLQNAQGDGGYRFFVTDRTQTFQKTASVLLGEQIDEEKVTLVEWETL